MSKKHFIALADAMRDLKPPSFEESGIGLNTAHQREYRLYQWQDTCSALADFCESQNAEFKRDRWLAYINGECGPNGGKIKAA